MDFVKHVYYCPFSPSGLRWARNAANNKIKMHDIAGRQKNDGYWQVYIIDRRYENHRIIYELCTGLIIPSGKVIDHIDRNPANNLIDNLQIVSRKENALNQKKRKTNNSGITGVHLSKTKYGDYWVAQASDIDGKRLSKRYAVKVYGFTQAKEKAIITRMSWLENLKNSGIIVAKDHGESL